MWSVDVASGLQDQDFGLAFFFIWRGNNTPISIYQEGGSLLNLPFLLAASNHIFQTKLLFPQRVNFHVSVMGKTCVSKL
jgi:hypothetical protein